MDQSFNYSLYLQDLAQSIYNPTTVTRCEDMW